LAHKRQEQSFLEAKALKRDASGDDSRGKELVLGIPWISFIHLEKSSSCQLIPDSSKVWKNQNG
jgi:hypothetical protein